MRAMPSPDRLAESTATALAKFGYAAFSDAAPDWAGMWDLLRGDFTTVHRPIVANYDKLSPSQQEAARIYMRRRLIADRLYEECLRAQADLNQHIHTEQVERYALARDAFEDSVEDFGRARQTLENLLPRLVA